MSCYLCTSPETNVVKAGKWSNTEIVDQDGGIRKVIRLPRPCTPEAFRILARVAEEGTLPLDCFVRYYFHVVGPIHETTRRFHVSQDEQGGPDLDELVVSAECMLASRDVVDLLHAASMDLMNVALAEWRARETTSMAYLSSTLMVARYGDRIQDLFIKAPMGPLYCEPQPLLRWTLRRWRPFSSAVSAVVSNVTPGVDKILRLRLDSSTRFVLAGKASFGIDSIICTKGMNLFVVGDDGGPEAAADLVRAALAVPEFDGRVKTIERYAISVIERKRADRVNFVLGTFPSKWHVLFGLPDPDPNNVCISWDDATNELVAEALLPSPNSRTWLWSLR
jgi:hypothetical protein